MTSDRFADTVGWVATAVFVASYFSGRAEVLVRVQIAGALIWMGYGVLTKAPPVIAANLLVVAAALWKARRERAARGSRGGPPSDVAPLPDLEPPATTTLPSRTHGAI
jgi:hypothetical protein